MFTGVCLSTGGVPAPGGVPGLEGVPGRGGCLVETPPGRPLLRAVRILPECILVSKCFLRKTVSRLVHVVLFQMFTDFVLTDAMELIAPVAISEIPTYFLTDIIFSLYPCSVSRILLIKQRATVFTLHPQLQILDIVFIAE